MKFYESEFYQQEVEDLMLLQHRLEEYHKIIDIMGMSPDIKIEYLHTLFAAVEKEQALYTRLQLNNTEEAKEMMAQLHTEAIESGMPPHYTLPSYHYELKNNIKDELRELGEDIDEEVVID